MLCACRPAKVVRQAAKHLVVEYDNGERDKCDPDNIFPHDVPIDFGKEVYDLQVIFLSHPRMQHVLLPGRKVTWTCSRSMHVYHRPPTVTDNCLQVGEFVEVSNNSKTDPCAWLGCVASVGKKYLVRYLLHTSSLSMALCLTCGCTSCLHLLHCRLNSWLGHWLMHCIPMPWHFARQEPVTCLFDCRLTTRSMTPPQSTSG